MIFSWREGTQQPSAWPRGRVACGTAEALDAPSDATAEPPTLASTTYRMERIDSEDNGLTLTGRASGPFLLRVDPAIPALPGLQRVELQRLTADFTIDAPHISPCSRIAVGELCTLRVTAGERLCVQRADLALIRPHERRDAQVSLRDAALLWHGTAAEAPWTRDPTARLFNSCPWFFFVGILSMGFLLVIRALPWLLAKKLPLPYASTDTLPFGLLIVRLQRLPWIAALLGPGDLELRAAPARWTLLRAVDAAALLLGLGLWIPAADALATATHDPHPAREILWGVYLTALALAAAWGLFNALRPPFLLTQLEAPPPVALRAAERFASLLSISPPLAARAVRWRCRAKDLRTLRSHLHRPPEPTLMLSWADGAPSTSAAVPVSLSALLERDAAANLPLALINTPGAIALCADSTPVLPALPPPLEPLVLLHPPRPDLASFERAAVSPERQQRRRLLLAATLLAAAAVALLRGASLEALDLMEPLSLPPPVLLGVYLAALAAVTLLRFNPVPHHTAPRRRSDHPEPTAPPTLLLDGATLLLANTSLPLDQPFALHLSRSPGELATVALNVELRGLAAPYPHLRLCTPLEPTPDALALPELAPQGHAITPQDLAALWPHLRAAAAIHGEPSAWTLDAAPPPPGDST